VESIDHIVLTVRDLDTTCDFYGRVLGMEMVTFEDGRRALHFGNQKINLHQAGREFEPKAFRATRGSADICFVTGLDPNGVVRRLRDNGVEVLEGPVERTGARGRMLSVYFRDPDGNLLEVSKYLGASR